MLRCGTPLMRRLHAARAARFERLARVVQPDVAALHEEVRDVQVVVVDEGDAAAEQRIERAPVDALQVVLAGCRRPGAPCRRRRSAPGAATALRMPASRVGVAEDQLRAACSR